MPNYWQCNTCDGAILAGSKFCPHCGADMAKPPRTQATAAMPSAPKQDATTRALITGATCLQRAIYVAGGLFLALAVFSFAFAKLYKPEDKGSYVLYSCTVCSGKGKVSIGVPGFSSNTCSRCYGTGMIEAGFRAPGDPYPPMRDDAITLSKDAWESLLRDHEISR